MGKFEDVISGFIVLPILLASNTKFQWDSKIRLLTSYINLVESKVNFYVKSTTQSNFSLIHIIKSLV